MMLHFYTAPWNITNSYCYLNKYIIFPYFSLLVLRPTTLNFTNTPSTSPTLSPFLPCSARCLCIYAGLILYHSRLRHHL